jgi:hypothetical protein
LPRGNSQATQGKKKDRAIHCGSPGLPRCACSADQAFLDRRAAFFAVFFVDFFAVFARWPAARFAGDRLAAAFRPRLAGARFFALFRVRFAAAFFVPLRVVLRRFVVDFLAFFTAFTTASVASSAALRTRLTAFATFLPTPPLRAPPLRFVATTHLAE